MVEANEIWKTYKMGDVDINALKRLSINVEENDFTALIGPSGSGKSTLLHILGCLDTPTRGVVKFDGRNISELKDRELTKIRCEKIGFVFQTFNLIPTFTAFENVEIQLRLLGVEKNKRKKIAENALETVNLGDRLNHLPKQLSGGERQRVAIARAICKNPKLILADEPTGNLDLKTTGEISDLLVDLNRKGQTILVVTHNPNVAKHAKKAIRMEDGGLVE
ncbi:MAG: ABC transporter ATP-binding protein [Candidatus Thermoplasmatota archaeon]|nr:ABC transporter ATP-binding protein [Candidatus Thermoplasmatota archaeon]